jgi:hypothetical protein
LLQEKRNVRGAAFHARKKALNVLKAKAVKAAKVDTEVKTLAAFGY